MINIASRRVERRSFLPNSFVSCKHASIEHNFVDIYTGVATLHNYQR